MRLFKDLDEAVLQGADDNLLAYVRNVPGLTRAALLAMRGLMSVLGIQDTQLFLWQAIEACLTPVAGHRSLPDRRRLQARPTARYPRALVAHDHARGVRRFAATTRRNERNRAGNLTMHLSYNKLRIYGECSLKYRYSYVEKLPRAPIKTLAAQRKLHHVLADYHHFAAKSGRVDEADLLAAYARHCDVAHNPSLPDTPAYRDGVDILRKYCQRENTLQRAPALFEKQIKCSFGPYNLQGRIDRLDFAGAASYSIFDYKLDRTVPDTNAAAQSRQLAFYHLLVREGLGLPVQDVRLLYLRHGVEQVQPVTETGLRQTVQWVDETADRMHNETDWQPRLGQGCATCAFKAQCPAKTGKARPTVAVWQQGSLLHDMEGKEED